MASEEHHGIPRLMWESEHEWRMRKLFIDANESVYQGDRLGALSMSWANWKFMGCSYNQQVQAILEECHDRCPEEVDREISRIREMAMPAKVKFVKPSESLGTRIGPPSSGKGGRKSVEFHSPDMYIDNKRQKLDNNDDHIKNFNTHENTPVACQSIPKSNPACPSNHTTNSNVDAISFLNQRAQKYKSKVEYRDLDPIVVNKKTTFRTMCIVDNIPMATGQGSTKKEAKRDSANKSLLMLGEQQSSVVTTPKPNTNAVFTPPTATCNDVGFTPRTPTNHAESTDQQIVPSFMLHYPPKSDFEAHENINPISLLAESSQKSKANIEYVDHQMRSLSTFKMTCVINNIEVATGEGSTQKECKRNTATKALEILRQRQPVIFKKIINHNKLETINKSSLMKNSYQHADKISDSNIGNKLLRKMGWSGTGGVGKSGSGIAEPVFVEGADGRKGVGHVTEDQTIHKLSVEDMLKAFLGDSSQDSIKFDPGLTSTDRAVVHKLCEKYRLKHKSFGKGEDRYLVVSRR